ncbi:AMP-binding protein [uncultured Roseibium sp.]|uniref:AMP-binding protein n=1 Tax=uncultured Roseibium sp. TaxID=1936171 RepID=UPI0026263D0B|nr:AMP-binding protein [uncultured Roseibium sp.]
MTFVGDRLEAFAAARPADTALKCGPVSLTWLEFFDRVQTAASAICEETCPGARIAFALTDPMSLLIGFFASSRTGRVALIVDPEWPDSLMKTVLEELSPGLFIQRGSQLFKTVDSQRADVSPEEGALFFAGFTSGSSGMPKGYVRTHRSWLKSFELSDREFSNAPNDRIVIAGGLTHSLHLYGAVCGLSGGRQVVLMERFDPKELFAELNRAKDGSVLYATPTQLHYLGEVARRNGPVDTVRQVLASGAKWQDGQRAAMAEVFPATSLMEFYGASETSFITVSRPCDDVPAGSVGRAAHGVQIAIGDPAHPLPSGTAGEIWVKSDLLFAGYICGQSTETRWHEGWLTVGDHGYLDGNGFLFLTGRSNRMIITSGLNVYPEEIEAQLLNHAAVATAVVVGRPDPVRGQILEAVVQLATPLDEAEDELLRHCRNVLAKGKLPKKIHIKNHFPLTAGGKPDIPKITRDLIGSGQGGTV